MRRLSCFFLFWAMMVSARAQTFPVQGLQKSPVTQKAFTHAHIVVAPGKVIDDGAILIRDGIIIAIGHGIAIPRGVTVKDLKGAWVYPGFIDAFTDYGMPQHPKIKPGPRTPQPNALRKGAVPWNDAIKSTQSAAALFRTAKDQARQWRAAGFTLVQTGPRDGIFRGSGALALLTDGPERDNLLQKKSLFYMSFSKGRSQQAYPTSLMGSIALIRQTLLDARWYKQAWQAYQRNNAQPKPEFNPALEALIPVVEGRQTVLFETNNYLDAQRAARIADAFNLKMIIKCGTDSYKRLADLKKTGRTILLPLNFPPKPDVQNPDAALDIPLGYYKFWDSAPAAPARVSAAGIRFAFTTQGLKKPQDMLKQLRLAIRRGLNETDALRALTQTPARILNIDAICGALEKGKLANWIVSDGNLFSDDRHSIQEVVIAGHSYPQTTAFDWRGEWELRLPRGTSPLSIKGPRAHPKAAFMADSSRRNIRLLSATTDQISLSWQRHGNAYLLSLLRTDSLLNGDLLLPDGSRVAVSGKRITPFRQKTKSPPLVPQKAYATTLPDGAYGVSGPPEQPKYILIRNATLWTAAKSGILAGYDMLIKQGIIREIGKNISAPRGALVIDATGKHISPGIIDEHSHIAISRGVNEAGQAVTAEVRIGDVVNPDNIQIYRQLAGGVTTSQLLHGSANPIGGQAQVIKLRWGANSEGLKFKAAPPTIKFALGENVKQSNWGDRFTSRYPQTRMGVKEIFIDAFERARAYGEQWKQYRVLPASIRKRTIPPRRDLELEALLEVLKGERFIHCHSYVQSEVLGLMEVADQFGFKIGTFTHILEGYKVAREMAAHGTMASTFADWWDYKFEVYEAIPYNTALMTSAGVVSSVNSDDAEMGRRLNQEAAKSMTYGGLSPEEAIKLVTINPARQLKVDTRTGSLEAGKDADFVIWNGPPLSGYSHVLQTWIEGRKYFDRDDDLKKQKANARLKNMLIQKALNTPGAALSTPGKYPDNSKSYRCDDRFDYMSAE